MLTAVWRVGRRVAAGVLLLAAMAVLPGRSSEPPLTGELALRAEIRQQVLDGFRREDFAALEAMAETFRQERALTRSGIWKLTVFYAAIHDAVRLPAADAAGWAELGARMRRWLDRHPTSPTPYVANGIVMKRHAWMLRPRKVLLEVALRPDTEFVVALEAASRFLDANREIARRDPHFYAVRADLAAALAMPADEFMELIDEGLVSAPGYLPIMFAGMDYFAPAPDAAGPHDDGRRVEAFANMMERRVGGPAGLEVYARLYWHAHAANYGAALLRNGTADWRKLSAGIDVLLVRYPDDWNVNNLARLACHAGDAEKTRALIERLDSKPLLQVWRTRSGYAACADWARRSATATVRP